MTLFLMKFNTKKRLVMLGGAGAPQKRTPYSNPNIKIYQLVICVARKKIKATQMNQHCIVLKIQRWK